VDPKLAEYNRFVDSSPQHTLFCHTWWLDAVAPGRYQIVTVRGGDQIRAAWPLVWAKRGRQRCAVQPLLTQKLGVLLPPMDGKYAERLSTEHRLVSELIAQLPEGARVEQHFHESFTNWLPFFWSGFRQTTRYSYIIEDLSDLEAVWREMRNTVRSEIRKARARGLRVRETEDLEYFYRINVMTFMRQGLGIPYDLEVVARVDEACRLNAGRKILVAEGADGRPHAAAYLIHDHDRAFLLMTGADPDLRGNGGGPLLNWELITYASTVCRRFDFEGSMKQSIEANFRGFGGRQTPYFRICGPEGRPAHIGIVRRKLAGALRRAARLLDGQ
jgi:hypothetical protein